MKDLRALAAVAALAFAATASAAVPAGRAPVRHAGRTDWSHHVAVTAQGGFRMGDPNAKVAIVEYGSLTCPHCRHFAETSLKPLVDQYVRTGKASYEFRPYMLNGLDVAVTLVAECDGPSRFFPMAEQLYATQPDWEGKVLKLPKGDQEKIGALPQDQMMVAYAKASGIATIAASHGISPARAQSCLKDQAAASRLMKIEEGAAQRGVQGTPTFFVNDKQVAAYDWATLEPFLKDAGG